MEQMQQPGVVHVYNENCFQCTHINPKATKTGTKCHVSRGNTLCPAGKIVFAIGFHAQIMAEKYADSMEVGDAEELQRIISKVKEQPETVQAQFFELAQYYTAKKMVDTAPDEPEDEPEHGFVAAGDTLNSIAEEDSSEDGEWSDSAE